MCSCHSILECCVTFSVVKSSIRSFVLFHGEENLTTLVKYAIESEMFSPSRNKCCCLIFVKIKSYFEKKFVLSLQTSYSDNASFKITIYSFA